MKQFIANGATTLEYRADRMLQPTPEIEALRAIVEILQTMTADEQRRTLHYLWSRYE